jgi:hypothetical protein
MVVFTTIWKYSVLGKRKFRSIRLKLKVSVFFPIETDIERKQQFFFLFLFVTETFQAFSWEPNGQKFCVVYGDPQSRVTVAFYRIVNATNMSAGKLELISKFRRVIICSLCLEQARLLSNDFLSLVCRGSQKS